MFNKTILLTAQENSLIEFYITKDEPGIYYSSTHKALPGMTWKEWINSKYYSPIYWDGFGTFDLYIDSYNEVRISGSLYFSYTLNGNQEISPNLGYVVICYIADTNITLSDGSVKPVKELTYDDEMLVWDFDNGCFAKAKALWITKPLKTDHYYRLKFSDGTELCLVGSDGKCHRLFNIENGEFTYGSYFHVGQHTFKDDGTTPYLISIELIEEEVEFYNVITHYHMNCFANGVLSSTGYNNMYPIKDMKFVKDNREIIPFETYEDVPEEFYHSLRLGEQDLSKRSVEKAKNYIGRMMKVMK